MFSRADLAQASHIISTGNQLIDYLLNGGIRLGTFNVITGFPGGGKSTLSGNLARSFINNGFVTMFLDSERSMSPERFKSLGVPLENLFLFKPQTLEEVLGVLIELVLTYRGLRDSKETSRKFNLPEDLFHKLPVIIWDSLAASPLAMELELLSDAVTPKKNLEKRELSRKLIPVGLNAQVMSVALRNLVPLMDAEDLPVTIIATNQYRSKLELDMYSPLPKSFYGERGEMPGGYAVKHWAYSLLEVSSAKRVESGQWVDIRILKNKSGPLRRGKVFFSYEKGFLNEISFTAAAIQAAAIEASGGWYKLDDTQKKYRYNELLDEVQNSKELFEKLQAQVLKELSLQDLLDVGI